LIYLDNAATTEPFFFPKETEFLANPSSPHALGIQAERKVYYARNTLSGLLFCKPEELTFTSGGTESNNMAILGFALAHYKRNVQAILCAEPWAHPAVLAPILFAESQGWARVHIGRVSKWPSVTKPPALLCLSHVHHETGDLRNGITQIKNDNPGGIIFVDGAQGFCKEASLPPEVADMYSFSGHKIHAAGGTGGLVVRNNLRLTPLFHGGNQENKRRAGTENPAGILHLAQAATFLQENREKHHAYVTTLRDALTALVDEIPGATVNARFKNNSPYIVNMSFPGTKGEVLVHMLSEKGVAVSMGAACKSRVKNEKTALAAMGFPRERTESALRFSFSYRNTMEEIEQTKEIVKQCVSQLRKISGWSNGNA